MTIALSMQRGQGSELTSYRIARALGMTPQQKLRQILAELVAEKKLTCRKVSGRSGRWDTYVYALPNIDVLRFNAKKREIAVNMNGKQVGQLELF
jgi:transcription initiation factor IIE alpha subunit